ncbi:hypothetical protein VCHA53O466_50314 [Vibrio chagasii]|nr:hypothetical protein VCHA53O466_50314 [Vibrio chagasii]
MKHSVFFAEFFFGFIIANLCCMMPRLSVWYSGIYIVIVRNVKPKDEIPSRMLTDSAIESRVNGFKGKPVSEKGSHQLRSALSTFANGVVDIDKVEKFYRHVDAYVRSDISPMVVCAKGCNQCCHVKPIDTSFMEAWYISVKVGIELKPELTNKARVKSAHSVEPCMFLKNGACSIYKFRPLACRLFFTVDHWKYCYEEVAHQVVTIMTQENLARAHATMLEHQQEGYDQLEGRGRHLADWFTE